MNIYFIITGLVFIVALIVTIIFMVISYLRTKRRQHFIKDFADYQTVTIFYLEKAFDLIYKDRILVFSIEGTRPDKKEFDQISKDFCRLFFKLLGPTLQEELLHFHGDMDTLVFATTEYFNNRSENDEIKEQSITNLMESEQT